jgi:hypothetical protein
MVASSHHLLAWLTTSTSNSKVLLILLCHKWFWTLVMLYIFPGKNYATLNSVATVVRHMSFAAYKFCSETQPWSILINGWFSYLADCQNTRPSSFHYEQASKRHSDQLLKISNNPHASSHLTLRLTDLQFVQLTIVTFTLTSKSAAEYHARRHTHERRRSASYRRPQPRPVSIHA